MGIYIVLTDKNSRLHIVNVNYIALSKVGNLMIYTTAGKIMSFEREKVKSVRVMTDETAVAAYLAKVIARIYEQKEQATAGKQTKNSVK